MNGDLVDDLADGPGGGAGQFWRSRWRDESGFAGGAEGLVFGLLVFVVGTLLVGNAWAVVDTKMAADAAARQAVRTYVEAPSAMAAAIGARRSADDALAGYGRSPNEASLSLASSAFGRCQRVSIEVRYRAPLLELPLVGNIGRAEPITAQHSELVDPYRSGLPGSASCA